MLNVTKVSNSVSEKIEVDQYIPIKIVWGKYNIFSEETLYWRTGDFKKSLIEIGIASRSGVIRSLTVVHSDKINFNKDKINWPELVSDGTPMFNVQSWPHNGRKDEDGLLELCCNGNTLDIIFSKEMITHKIVSGRICFGLNVDANLCVVSVTELHKDEELQIRDTLQFIKRQTQIEVG